MRLEIRRAPVHVHVVEVLEPGTQGSDVLALDIGLEEGCHDTGMAHELRWALIPAHAFPSVRDPLTSETEKERGLRGPSP